MPLRGIITALFLTLSPGWAVAAVPPCLQAGPDSRNVIAIAVATDDTSTTYQWTLDGLPVPDQLNQLRFQADSFREATHTVSASRNGDTICASDLTVATLPLRHVAYQEAYPVTRAEKLRQQVAVAAAQVDDSIAALLRLRLGYQDLEQQASEQREQAVYSEAVTGRTRLSEDNLRQRVADSLQGSSATSLDPATLCAAATDADSCESLIEARQSIRSQLRSLIAPPAPLPPAAPLAAPAPILDSQQSDPPQLQKLEQEKAGTERQRPTETLTVAQLATRLKLLKADQQLIDRALAAAHSAETQRSDELNAARASAALAETRANAERASSVSLHAELEGLLQQLTANTAALSAVPAETSTLHAEDSSLTRAVEQPWLVPIPAAANMASALPAIAVASPLPRIVKVFYVTEREPGTQDGDLVYLAYRSTHEPLHFGVASVSIPPNHVAGNIELPAWYKFERHPDRQTSFTIGLQPDSEAQFYQALRDHLSTRHKEVFVFVHGFNNSFDDAILRTAQLANDIGFDGAPITYDWPSHESLLDYKGDKTEAQASFAGLEAFLNDLSLKTGAETINVIAHSMGNYVTMNALKIAVERHPLKLHLNQLILAAPDIERVDMDQIMPRVLEARLARRITLYASRGDWAMIASNFANSAPPVGGTSPVWTLRGVETIDASTLEDGIIGHDYFATTSTVLKDIYTLITTGNAPLPRPGMATMGAYWAFLPVH